MDDLFDLEAALDYFPQILSCLDITLLIVTASVSIGVIFGILLAWFRLYKIPILNQFSIVYVSFIRGTPIIVQMFMFFYGLPMLLNLVGIDINRWDKMFFIIVSYGFNTAAFFSEIIRASIQSVAIGQAEAAYSIGLTRLQAFFRIIAPQAINAAIPSLGTMLVVLLQDTSLAFTFGIIDVMGEVQAIGANTRRYMEGYVDAAIIFFVVAVIIEKGFGSLEKRLVIQKSKF